MNKPLKAATALTIAANAMPAANTWFWSGDGSSDHTGGTSGAGVKGIEGHKADVALVDLLVTDWASVLSILFRAQVKGTFGSWVDIDPPILLDSAAAGARFVTAGSNKVAIASGLGTSTGVRLVVPINGAKAFRFGFTPGDANTRTSFAMTAGFELVAHGLYS